MTGMAQTNVGPQGPPSPTADASAKQLSRRAFLPPLPSVFSSGAVHAVQVDGASLLNEQDKQMNAPFLLSPQDEQILRGLFPHTIDTPFVRIEPAHASQSSNNKPLNVGVVLSGGQAAGGHNVICGVYDYIHKLNPESTLYGFLGGPHGVYSGNYKVLDKNTIDKYRNMGGFDMIKSGRHKIEEDSQKQASLEICKKLNLDGLVIIGGDDSNTNAAILSEYFKSKGSKTKVIGCPKTIDGDLKNYYVEVSFGFDTACRVYSCAVGNLMMQTLTQKNVYQFVRLMGRSASLLTLECALRCHPNMTFVGEEVQAKKQSLKALVAMTADLVEARAKLGKHYGVILLPEGLIEFIPEVGVLIGEINNIVAAGEFDRAKLTAASREVLDMLPHHTQQQLLLDRDPHGNVQVALIHTEQLLLELTTEELHRRDFKHPFYGRCTYLGYEGRSGFPSDFDATYCYGLGNVAGALIQNGVTSCMAVLKGMSSSSDVRTWVPAGVPLTKMMNLENRKGKTNVPVIKKFLVDIEKPLFKAFEQVREAWKLLDVYLVPGPMQLNGEELQLPYTLTGPPPLETLLPATASAAYKDSALLQQQGYRHYFSLLQQLRSPLQQSRQKSSIEVPQGLLQAGVVLQPTGVRELLSSHHQQHVKQLFPKTAATQGGLYTAAAGTPEKRRVGVILAGESTPGLSNVLLGIIEKVTAAGGEVMGILGDGTFTNLSQMRNDIEMQKNQNAFPFLGRTVLEEQQLLAPGGALGSTASLDVLVVLRGTFSGCASLAERLAERGDRCCVLNVCGDSDFCLSDPSSFMNAMEQIYGSTITFSGQQNDQPIACENTHKLIRDAAGAFALGFDTQTKAAAELVGNLMTDSNSAAKYFYFCKVGGGRGAEAEVAMQTHPNMALISTLYADSQPVQIAELRSVAVALAVNKGDASALSGADSAVFNSIPKSFQQKLVQIFGTPGSFPLKAASFPLHDCLATMVANVLKERKAAGKFGGSFAPICFDLSDQVRGSFPSAYDCSVGYTLGLLSGMLAVSPALQKLPSAAVLIGNPTATVTSFSPVVVPLPVAAMACGLKPSSGAAGARRGLDAAAAAGAFDIQLHTPTQNAAAAAVSMQLQQQEFLLKDTYLNSGPIQFHAVQGAADADRECNFLLSRSL
ncbi:phosphofructokinase, putative [Eimeria tenella]|uniref:Pyrophosphate--fructose 6-phosphate 1-phosphotransferase n=1 Tax=Eimeria tenella TaxID=5802 RepID=U6L3G0_EIMTE|nr:phosphofructokinase, putative [Eimeria tenella]CDJ42305.1 phosphofructokinase, putative [Eimeria tenella]|eukprot:XP_013233055.1 phosphofructokinase, putative [Eimeria tenella]